VEKPSSAANDALKPAAPTGWREVLTKALKFLVLLSQGANCPVCHANRGLRVHDTDCELGGLETEIRTALAEQFEAAPDILHAPTQRYFRGDGVEEFLGVVPKLLASEDVEQVRDIIFAFDIGKVGEHSTITIREESLPLIAAHLHKLMKDSPLHAQERELTELHAKWKAEREKEKWEPWRDGEGKPLICTLCHNEIPHCEPCYHGDGKGGFLHETCSYQYQIKRLTASTERERLEARIDAIEQCAVEAGERSPEGVSSHTMLGDMWDERIAGLRARLAALPATEKPEYR
jgi:hypothetical protein